MRSFVSFGEEVIGQGQRFEFARGADRIGGDQVELDRAGAAQADILKGKDHVAAIGAEGGIAVTTVAFKGGGVFGFVGEGIVEEQITKSVVADVAVDEEEQVAVPIEVDDLIRKGKALCGEFVEDGCRNGFAVLYIHNADGIDKYAV